MSKKLEPKQIAKYVCGLNSFPSLMGKQIKTILAIDGTGSMGPALTKTMVILDSAFDEINQILTKFKSNNYFEMKIIIYRNYNAPAEMLLLKTPFEQKTDNLKGFMRGIQPAYGWGREAVEVGLQQINRDEKVSQVIIIADAAGNSLPETQAKRASKTEQYWNNQNFPLADGNYELQQIVKKEIPIHSFYIDGPTKPHQYFTNMSNQTHGQCQKFNVNAPDASSVLAQFISKRILEKAASS